MAAAAALCGGDGLFFYSSHFLLGLNAHNNFFCNMLKIFLLLSLLQTQSCMNDVVCGLHIILSDLQYRVPVFLTNVSLSTLMEVDS